MKSLMLLLSLLSLGITGLALTPSSFLSTADKDRLRRVFANDILKDDLPSVAYAILGYKLLGETAPKKDICDKLQNGVVGEDVSVGSVYQASAAARELVNCKLTIGQKASQVISLSEEMSVSSLYYAAMAQNNLGIVVDKANVAKLLFAALKKDDSLARLGYAFILASAILDKTDAQVIFDRVEDAVVQADEIDGKILQFEGGLSVTHLIVHGAYQLGSAIGQSPPISKTQAVKFANYFLGRKNVGQSKGAYHLLQSLTTLAVNDYHLPVVITTVSSVVSESQPVVKVGVCDLLGRPLGVKMQVELASAVRQSDAKVIVLNKKMTPVVEDSLFEVDFASLAPGRGFYELNVVATPAKPDPRMVGNEGALLTIKALCSIVLEDVEVSVTGRGSNSLQYPQKLPEVIDVDRHHRISLKFVVLEKKGREKMKVHQAFVRMENVASNEEILFVAEVVNNEELIYQFDLDVGVKRREFEDVSGVYKMQLIIGDAVISNPLSWHIGDFKLTFPSGKKEKKKFEKIPEIEHKFRDSEKRPSILLSNTFTLLCLFPITIMIFSWTKLGINLFTIFPLSSIAAIGFHLSLGAIFCLYYMFWLRLDMFVTIKYLFMLSIITFLCGHSILASIAEDRRKKSTDKVK